MAGQQTTGTGELSQATQSFFVFVRDNNTGQIKSVAVPGDVQIGLDGNAADLTLMGRFSVAAKNYDVTFANKGILQTSPDDTIIGVSLVTTPMSGRISMYLSQSPREGELHFVKDLTATSDTVPIDIYPTSGFTIDGRTVVTLSDPTASLALVFLNGNWYRLVAGLGSSGGSGADPLAEYVLLAGDGSLPNSRTLQMAANLTMTDTGPAGTVTLNLSQILGSGAGTYTYATVTADAYGRITGIANGATPPPAGASYVTAQAEPALPNRRLLSGTKGVIATDGGAGATMGLAVDPTYFVGAGGINVAQVGNNLVISGSTGTTVTGSIGVLAAPGSPSRLSVDPTYFVGQGGISVTPIGNNLVISGSGAGTSITGSVGVLVAPGSPSRLSIDPSFFIGQGLVTIFQVGNNLVISGSSAPSGFQNAPAQAEYLLLALTSALPQGRLISPGAGITMTDGGPFNTFTIGIDNRVVATVTGTTFTGPVVAKGGLSGSLQMLTDGHSPYLVAGSGILLVTNSLGQVVITNLGNAASTIALSSLLQNAVIFSPVRYLTSGTQLPTSSIGSLTTGVEFYPIDQCIISGVRFYWAGPATTIHASLWSGSILLTSSSVSVTGPGIYSSLFSSSYTITGSGGVNTSHYVAIWDTSGAHYTSSPDAEKPFPVTLPLLGGPLFYFTSFWQWASGNVAPVNDIPSTDRYPVEPILSLISASTAFATNGADPNAAYALLVATSSLPLARTMVAGRGMAVTDNGPGSTVVFTSPFTLPVFTMTANASNAVTNAADSATKQVVGGLYFNPPMLAKFLSGSKVYKWRAILETSELPVSAAIDLYDPGGIVYGVPGIISGSIMSASSLTPVQLEVDLTSQLAGVVSPGPLEARLWRYSPVIATGSFATTSSVSCLNARVEVEFS